MNITLALQRAVRGFKMRTRALAAELDMSETTLNHKVSPTYPTQFCSPEEMLRLMEVTGDHGALIALADALGYVLLRMPHAGLAVDDPGAVNALLRTVQEFADTTQAVSAAPAHDGEGGAAVTANECARVEAEGAQAIAAIQDLVAMVVARHQAALPAHLRAVA